MYNIHITSPGLLQQSTTKTTEMYCLTVLKMIRVKSRCWQGCVLCRLRRSMRPGLVPAPGDGQHSMALLGPRLPPMHTALPRICLWVSSLGNTPVILRAHPTHLNYTCKDCFQINLHIQVGTRCQDFKYLLEGHNSTLTHTHTAL